MDMKFVMEQYNKSKHESEMDMKKRQDQRLRLQQINQERTN